MPSVPDVLREVEALVETTRRREAEDRLKLLVEGMSPDDLFNWADSVRDTIELFAPKRRKALTSLLATRLAPPTPAPAPRKTTTLEDSQIAELRAALDEGLVNLSRRYIFQWSTHYQSFFSQMLERIVRSAGSETDRVRLAEVVTRSLRSHAKEIFEKGFRYVTSRPETTAKDAVAKSLSGLQRFLEVVLRFFAEQTSQASLSALSVFLPPVASAGLRGILEGYGESRLGEQTGFAVLEANPQLWFPCLPFLSSQDAASFLQSPSLSASSRAALRAVSLVQGAIEQANEARGRLAVLPAFGQYNKALRRLELSLRIQHGGAGAFLEVQIFLEHAFVTEALLKQAAQTRVALVLAPLHPGLAAAVAMDLSLQQVVVPLDLTSPSDERQRSAIRSVLDSNLPTRPASSDPSAVLMYNFAKEFPLENQQRVRLYHVSRPSVRDLMRTLEQRTGVRLWCSVRRSGKTTACFDLASDVARVVPQTCLQKEEHLNSTVLYDGVCEALESGKPLAKRFLIDCLERCSENLAPASGRAVLVIDEYEMLFGRLRARVRQNPDLRFTVAIPLLNQLELFAHENLLVLLGQQPDAHYILMDQNPLSAYVQQDEFPLFAHTGGTISGEFAELLRRALANQVAFNASFADAVFGETSGHPFLTVNLLRDLVDWLIGVKKQAQSRALSGTDFEEFAAERLGAEAVRVSREYEYFSGVVSEATSGDGQAVNPWLFAVYTAIREIGRQSPTTLSCSRGDFAHLMAGLGGSLSEWPSERVLRTGAAANFLTFDEVHVRPRVRLLARIAGVASLTAA